MSVLHFSNFLTFSRPCVTTASNTASVERAESEPSARCTGSPAARFYWICSHNLEDPPLFSCGLLGIRCRTRSNKVRRRSTVPSIGARGAFRGGSTRSPMRKGSLCAWPKWDGIVSPLCFISGSLLSPVPELSYSLKGAFSRVP